METESKQEERTVFPISVFGLEEDVKLFWEVYSCNGTLALQLNCKPAEEDEAMFRRGMDNSDEVYIEPFGIVTVNLPESEFMPANVQFVDTNNLPGIDRWLMENKIAEPTGVIARSGYCAYQAFKFNAPKEALQKVADRKSELRVNEAPLLRPKSSRPTIK